MNSPVVFLILPVTLLFAFYPGVVGLNPRQMSEPSTTGLAP